MANNLYTVPFDDVRLSTSADAYKTLVALILAASSGYRIRLRELGIGPADDSPQDESIVVDIARIASVSGGSAGTAATTIAVGSVAKRDLDMEESPASAKIDYSVEPTTYETYSLFTVGLNQRGTIVVPFDAFSAPMIREDQHLALRAACRDTVGPYVSGYLAFERC